MHTPALTVTRDATRADLEALPPHIKGELIDGVLYAMTRPRGAHQYVAGEIGDALRSPFQRGTGGPGAWLFLQEPGIELPGSPEFSPDLAGWTRDRFPVPPRDGSITVVPDWVCEVLSPTTRRHNFLVKRPFYARIGVPWLWFVDLDAWTLAVSRLEGGRWVEVAVFGDERSARVEPFGAVPIDVGAWWEGIEAGS